MAIQLDEAKRKAKGAYQTVMTIAGDLNLKGIQKVINEALDNHLNQRPERVQDNKSKIKE